MLVITFKFSLKYHSIVALFSNIRKLINKLILFGKMGIKYNISACLRHKHSKIKTWSNFDYWSPNNLVKDKTFSPHPLSLLIMSIKYLFTAKLHTYFYQQT